MASQASSLRTTADSSVGPWCLSTGACLLSSRAHSFAFLYSLPLFPCLTPSVCLWNRLLTQFRKPKVLLQFPLSRAEPRSGEWYPGPICSPSPCTQEGLLWCHPAQLGRLESGLWQAKNKSSELHSPRGEARPLMSPVGRGEKRASVFTARSTL